MKVAILATRAGNIRRGVETVAYELSRRLPCECRVLSLAESDWTVRVPGITRDRAVHRAYTRLATTLKLPKIDAVLVPRVSLFGPYMIEEVTYGRGLARALDEFGPGVVLNLAGPVVGRYCRAYRSKTGVPFVTAGGAGVGAVEKKNVFTRPDAYIAINPEAKRFVERFDPNMKTFLVPNGADVETFTPDGPKMDLGEIRKLAGKPALELRSPVVISTSALVKFKRLHLAIDAMSRLGKGTLLFAGDSSDGAGTLALAENVLGDRFGYIGTLDYPDMPRFYRVGDVFCLPSVNEPFGNVLVEAMACGLPVVSTDDESRRWILGDGGGIPVDVTDPSKFAGAIEQAASPEFTGNPRRESLRFSWAEVAGRYSEILRGVYSG